MSRAPNSVAMGPPVGPRASSASRASSSTSHRFGVAPVQPAGPSVAPPSLGNTQRSTAHFYPPPHQQAQAYSLWSQQPPLPTPQHLMHPPPQPYFSYPQHTHGQPSYNYLGQQQPPPHLTHQHHAPPVNPFARSHTQPQPPPPPPAQPASSTAQSAAYMNEAQAWAVKKAQKAAQLQARQIAEIALQAPAGSEARAKLPSALQAALADHDRRTEIRRERDPRAKRKLEGMKEVSAVRGE
jgi:hypothetical protein